jgi:hypothetical protein
MRKLLLAGAALAGVTMVASLAMAQSAAPVFPMTTRAGKLNGAAPGTVQVSIGATMFSAIWFSNGTGQNNFGTEIAPYELYNYIRLYPNFDYASPSGVHFGLSGEIRADSDSQGQNRASRAFGTELYWHSAFGYVSSANWGKVAFGTPSSGMEAMTVGLTDDFNTGGFYGEYGFNGPVSVPWLFADVYDGNVPKQKLAYVSPSFAGFQFAVSFQPSSNGLRNGGGNVTSVTEASALEGNPLLAGTPAGGVSKNRVSVGGKFAQNFGGFSVNASLGYDHATPVTQDFTGGTLFKNVNVYDAGVALGFGGFILEGHFDGGNWSAANTDSGSPMGPKPSGAKNTWAWAIAPEYASGPWTAGFSYIGYNFDTSAVGGNLGNTAASYGLATGGSYVIGPGVSLYLDGLYGKVSGAGLLPIGNIPRTSYQNLGLGIGTYFSF